MGYQDDYGPEIHLLKELGSFSCAITRLQETTTRKVLTDSVLPDDIMGSSKKLILGHSNWTSGKTCSTGTGYPQREKALHPWWFSRYNWTNPQLTWFNPGNSGGLHDLHRPFQSRTSDSTVSSLLQRSLSQKTMLAHSAEEKSRNSLSSELSYALSLGPLYKSYAPTILPKTTATNVFMHK